MLHFTIFFKENEIEYKSADSFLFLRFVVKLGIFYSSIWSSLMQFGGPIYEQFPSFYAIYALELKFL